MQHLDFPAFVYPSLPNFHFRSNLLFWCVVISFPSLAFLRCIFNF
jgi:hypothetical protein